MEKHSSKRKKEIELPQRNKEEKKIRPKSMKCYDGFSSSKS